VFQLLYPELRRPQGAYRFVTVVGNVGAGKSTLTEALSRRLPLVPCVEPGGENPFLDDYYRDQARWGFHMQVYFLTQRCRDLGRIIREPRHHLQDRSIYEDVQVFARGLMESGKMSRREWDLYWDMFMLLHPTIRQPDLAIWLDGSLQTVLARIRRRGRPAELSMPESYWASLHERYQRFMEGYRESPVLRVDIDQFDLNTHPQHLEVLAARVAELTGLPLSPLAAGWR
jgi:deoxyadenosine/deoxycytidine kinase